MEEINEAKGLFGKSIPEKRKGLCILLLIYTGLGKFQWTYERYKDMAIAVLKNRVINYKQKTYQLRILRCLVNKDNAGIVNDKYITYLVQLQNTDNSDSILLFKEEMNVVKYYNEFARGKVEDGNLILYLNSIEQLIMEQYNQAIETEKDENGLLDLVTMVVSDGIEDIIMEDASTKISRHLEELSKKEQIVW